MKYRLLLSICGLHFWFPPQSEIASYAPADKHMRNNIQIYGLYISIFYRKNYAYVIVRTNFLITYDDIFLYSYEAYFIQSLLSTGKKQ